jgi:hypothetical protein
VRISTYAMPPLAPNATVRPELVEGLANAGNGTNNALPTTPGLVGLATFQIAVLQQSDGPTQFTGKILDHTGKPLQGVRVTVSRTPLSVTTDATGNFTFLQDVPQGKLDLFVDGRAVTGTVPLPGNNQSSPTQYPSLHFEVLAIRGQKNILPHPIYLPPLLMSQAKIVGGNEDVSLTIPGRDGFEMIVKANSVTFPDGTRIGPLVVSPVADDRLPMSPPGGGSSFMPGAAATIQPSGTRFDPPIEVRLPNTSGYAPGERVVIYHWDHDIGQYVAMGQATVTDDGAQLITDPGSGITKAGWHGPPTPPPCVDTGTTGTCAECQKVESVGGGGRCPAVKICMKDYASSASCDDKDECTANDACKDGSCKGEPIKVKITARTTTICKDRSKSFVSETSPLGRALTWTSSSDAASVVNGVVTGLRSGITVIKAVDNICGKAFDEVTVRVLYPRVDYTGSNEQDYFLVNALELPLPLQTGFSIEALGLRAKSYPQTQFKGGYEVDDGKGGVKSSCYDGQGTEGTEWDALRHVYGACLLHRIPGVPPGWMEGFLNAHENKDRGINPDDSDNPDVCVSSEMDQNNNTLGKSLAQQPGECGELAKAAINSGAAQVNRPYDPVVCRKLF